MASIFSRDPLDKIDRRKQKAEKKLMRARQRAWRRRHRAEAWQDFRKYLRNLFSNPTEESEHTRRKPGLLKRILFNSDPLAKTDRQKQKAERQLMRAREKSWRRNERAKRRQNFNKHINNFLSDPFAKRQLTSEEEDIRRFKTYARRDRKLARQKWWAKFRNNPWRIIIPRKKRRDPGGGYLYVYHMTKLERKEIAQLKRKQMRDNFRRVITIPELRQKFVFGYLHSTAYFILAFMLIYILYQAITILVASSYNIPVVWYYYRLKFPLYTFSPLYTRQALIVIFASGPILSIMLAFVFLRLFFSESAAVRRFQLFYLWGFICGANMFFGAYIAGFFTRTEFIYTSEWLFMSNVFDIEEIIFTAISFIMLFVIGRIVTPLFLLSSGSVTIIKPEVRVFFIISQVIFPWLTGIVILFLITLPTYYIPFILKTLTPGLVLLPSLYLYDSLKYENIHQSGVIQRNYFRWSIVIVAVAILFFYRVLLSWGLKVS